VNIDVNELLQVAGDTAVATGNLILEKWSQPRTIKNKGFRDLVTDTDVAAQKLITDTIQARFPAHGFLTEEDDSHLPTDGPIIWVIDPVDGTTNFSRSIPSFCVSIGAVSAAGELLAGVVYDPMRNEMFGAAHNQGAWLRTPAGGQQPIHVSQVDRLEKTIFALDWSRQPSLRKLALEFLVDMAPLVQDVRAMGTAALALAWLAAGRFDGYFNMQLSPWDLAAACLIIQEAGGQISEPDGRPWQFSPQNKGVVVSNGRIHQPILEHLLPISKQLTL
jgi:myo-inositol-1(or 4)-monophosphatase